MSNDVVVVESTPLPTLFGTDSPERAMESARRYAKVLAAELEPREDRRALYVEIQGKRHVLVEGWTLLGSLLGISPVVVWTKELADGAGWEARVEAHTLDGRTVGAAEAECRREERMWKNRDSYALRSMAQTRATSKALRMPLGFIVELAGYNATPAEEMIGTQQVQDTTPPFDVAAYTKDAVQMFRKWDAGQRANSFKEHSKTLLGGKPASADEVRKVIEAMSNDYWADFPDEAPF